MSIEKFNFRDELAEEVGRIFFHFLENFNCNKIFPSKLISDSNFYEQLNLMNLTFRSTVYINFENLILFSDELADIIEDQYQRLENYISDSLGEFIEKNAFRKRIYSKKKNQKYWVGFYNLPALTRIKRLNSKNLNKLKCISGIVTRTSEIHLQLVYGSFRCENYDCKFTLNYVEQFIEFNEPKICPKCRENNSWVLIFEDSYLVEYQKIKIQENEDEFWEGKINQTLDVLLREDFVNLLKPGDKCFFSGFLSIIPGRFKMSEILEKYSYKRSVSGSLSAGFNQINRKTHFKTCFVVSHLFSLNFNFNRKFFGFNKINKINKFISKKFFFSRKEKEKILKIRTKKNLIKLLTGSLAPSVEGFEHVKIGILLLLVGGIRKKTLEKIRLKGNINVCLMGDLILEKKKLLQSLFEFFPRTILVDGKNTGPADLTASLFRDPETKSFSIQAGALMLSDNGFCCIENIDKLKSHHQIFLYETLEHQTITFVKADIRTTFNARSSILATIDKEKGVYDKKKNVQKNSGLNFSIFSRFDLFFLVLQDPKKSFESILLKTIQNFNKQKKKKIKKKFIRAMGFYLSFARLVKPILKNKSKILIVRIYIYLRKCQFLEHLKTNYFTIRQLETIIRLAEAFSKLYLCKYVKKFHVKAAGKLFFNTLYPFNKSSRIEFQRFFRNFSNIGTKKKEKFGNNCNSQESRKLSFGEFQMLFKSIIYEIKNNKINAYRGVPLKRIIKGILKIQNYRCKAQRKNIHVKKIFLVIKYMIFSYESLFYLKSRKMNTNRKNFHGFVILKKGA